MNLTKSTALHLYYYGSLPWRTMVNRRRAEAGRAPIMVLFYHRVADDSPNDWTISRRTFAKQINWLQRRFDMISLAEAQERIRQPSNYRPAVSITFDDGYADNCDFALPLLISRNIPCTYFVTLDNVANNRPFPHDVALQQPLSPNSIEQLRALSTDGIEIGGHTRTHPDLGTCVDIESLFDEIVVASRELGQLVDQPIRYFAFPFGLPAHLNAAGFQLAREYALEGVCSAYGGYNFSQDDPFHLQRIHADPEMIRLRNWLHVDPRKENIERFVYDHPAALAAARSLHPQADQPSADTDRRSDTLEPSESPQSPETDCRHPAAAGQEAS